MAASWTIVLGLALVGAGGPAGRWLGQDGHDFVNPSPELKPNGYQDIHIALAGLPPRKVKRIIIRPFGSGEWNYNGPPGSWHAVLVRTGTAPTAGLYYESDRVETGRAINLKIVYEDGSESDVTVKGGKFDPDLRMPQAGASATWAGQVRRDLAGACAAVGPDGYQDTKITLGRLPATLEVKEVILEAPGGIRWNAGLNPNAEFSAELVRDPKDRTRAEFYFQPNRDLAGAALRVTIRYTNDKADTISLRGARTDPRLAMPRATLPSLASEPIEVRWLGQDGAAGSRPGDVHLALAKLPAARPLAAVVVTDSVLGAWVFRASDRTRLDAIPAERPLVVKRGKDRTRADLFLAPDRDETGATITVRLVLQDGASAVGQVAGGASDPFKTLAPPPGTTVTAKPGDDLNDLAGKYGTVNLAAGTYRLARPLVLEKSVTIAGRKGVVLEFSQAQNDPPWTAAIKVHRSATTLKDFAVRFAGPIRWDSRVNYSPAVIGTTDTLDTPHDDPRQGLTFTGLDLVTPELPKARDWQESFKLMRLISAGSGTISKCTFRGGMIEFFNGPWQIVDNEYRGADPGTYNWCFIGGHDFHDLVVRGNRTHNVEPAGKTWRFLVMTGYGHRVRVEDNTIADMGPRVGDTIPAMNTPETIISESYKLRFEGKPAAISADGRVVGIVEAQGEPPQAGDVVSVLSGPGAGQWRTVAQTLSPTAFLLTAPLPKGTETISIARGFVDMQITGNTIDARGSRTAVNMLLGGNNFGTVIRKNRIQGGGEALRLQAAPSEAPVLWSWSHAPYLGGVIEDNVFEDSFLGCVLGVEHNKFIKSNAGRTYMSLTVRNNVVRWTDAFLRERAQSGEKAPLRGITLGYAPSHDPNELIVTEEGDRLDAPATARGRESLRVQAARLNGKPIQNQDYALPPRTATSAVTKPH